MGRIRSVKPELNHAAQLAERTDTARLLYYALLGEVDDWGRAQASPRYLHGIAFWGRPRSIRTVTDALAELEAANIVVTYDSEGGRYLFIQGWGDQGSIFYQVVKRKQPSSLPAPSSLHAPTEHPPSTHDAPPDHDHDHEQDHEHDHDLGAASLRTPLAPLELTPPEPRKPKRVPASPDQQRAIDAFHDAYRDAYGAKPTWTGKQIGQMATLVRKHGADEVIRRVAILASSPPTFLRGSPWDVGTLLSHFDKLAAPSVDRTTQTARQRNSPTATAMDSLREAMQREGRDSIPDPFADAPHAAEVAP